MPRKVLCSHEPSRPARLTGRPGERALPIPLDLTPGRPYRDLESLRAGDVLRLQRASGNQAVTQLLRHTLPVGSESSSLAQLAVQRVWNEIETKGVYEWNVPIDGAKWFADSEGMMWFSIANKQLIKEGSFQSYQGYENQKKSWDDWNRISVNPHPSWGALKPEAESRDPIAEIQAVANTNRTTGTWYAWGPAEYMIQWETASSIKEHGLSIKGGAASPQGPGLYLAKEAWRSGTYAKEGAYLLVAILKGVPAIDMSNGAQMTAIGRLGLTLEDLYETSNLADILLIYTSAGTYGRLTTNEGVQLTTKLSNIGPATLKQQYVKMGETKSVLKKLAKEHGVDTSDWV